MANYTFENPVLDSYIAGVAERRKKEQEAFQNKLAQEANKRADEQLKQYGEHLKAQEAAENARLDMQRTQIALEKQSHEMQAREHVAKMIGSGAMKTRPQSMGEQLSSPVGGDFGGVDPRTISYATPAELLAQKVTEAKALGGVQAETQGAITKATETAKRPFEIERSAMGQAQKVELQKLQGQQQVGLQELKGKQELEQIGKTIEGQKAIAHIHGQYGLDSARINNFAGISTPEEWDSAVLSRVTGQAPLGPSKKDELIRAHIYSAGYVPFDPKDAAKLKELHSMDPLVNKMREIINNLPEDVPNAFGQKIAAKVPLTEINNIAGLIKGVSGNIARVIGGEKGVLTEKDINRAGALLVQPGITVKQAKERLAFFLDNVSSKGLGVYLSGQSPKQQLLNLRTYDFDPEVYNRIITHGGKKGYAFKKSADGEWGYFDTKSGTYKSLDEK
jgi:hypothetical protein